MNNLPLTINWRFLNTLWPWPSHWLLLWRHSTSVRCILRAIALGCLLLAVPTPVIAAERTPLLMPGKTSLYQRVLTRPDAMLYPIPGSKPTTQPLPPLSVFFVYDRKRLDNREWLEVGAASQGPTNGWLLSDQTITWKQTLTVAFTNPAMRQPALFFSNLESLKALIQSTEVATAVGRLRAQIEHKDIPVNFPVIATEPPTYVDPQKHFYLLPILNFEGAELAGGRFDARLLKVAAVTLKPGDQDLLSKGNVSTPLANNNPLLKNYRIGIVFVVDTTKSMGPYLNRTREAIHSIYQRLKNSAWGRNVSFGLVAFRNNIKITPGLEYVTKVFATLQDGLDEDSFFRHVNQVTDTRISSHSFNEDAYAGIFTAIREFDWSGYDGRVIVLITDAGALEGDATQTHLSAAGLHLLAQVKEGGEVAIYVLHLLTPEGRDNHMAAAAQYQTLTRWGDVGSLYFGVATGYVAEFGKQVDALAAMLVQQVEDASTGKLVEVPSANTTNKLERQTAIVGRAMQLAYLGRAEGTEAPRLISAWVSDLDLTQPTHSTLEVRVLVTKDQLSDLQQTLEAILKAGEEKTLNPKNFFAALRSAAATLARDPENVNEHKVRRLADVGLVGEWLEDLPYKSQIMEITEDDWLQWSFTQQREFLDKVEEKINVYQKLHDNTDLWINLDAGHIKGDAVCAISMEALP